MEMCKTKVMCRTKVLLTHLSEENQGSSRLKYILINLVTN